MAEDSELQLRIVRFWAGGVEFAVEAAEVAAMGPADENAPRVETLLGLSLGPGTPSRVLFIHGIDGAAPRPVRVGEPVQIDILNGEAFHPLPPLLATRIAFPCLRALIFTPNSVLPVITLSPGPDTTLYGAPPP